GARQRLQTATAVPAWCAHELCRDEESGEGMTFSRRRWSGARRRTPHRGSLFPGPNPSGSLSPGEPLLGLRGDPPRQLVRLRLLAGHLERSGLLRAANQFERHGHLPLLDAVAADQFISVGHLPRIHEHETRMIAARRNLTQALIHPTRQPQHVLERLLLLET